MKDLGFFLGFFAILLVLGLSTAGGKGLFSSTTSTSTATRANGGESVAQYESSTETATGTRSSAVGSTVNTDSRTSPAVAPDSGATQVTQSRTTAPTKKLTNAQIESKIASLYRRLDSLSREVRELELRSPVSPYAGLVRLTASSVRTTDPEREYVKLTARHKIPEGINISNWYLESYVTEERAALPQGDRVIDEWRRPVLEDIYLLPSETAYVLTGDSPMDVSFHENMCTGYLNEEYTFYPSVQNSCPRPLDEMERFADIALDNDTCYDYVERIKKCTLVEDDDFDEADLNGACRRFIESTFNYNDCVRKHRYDPFFDNVGYWHIYLGRNDELWRYEREIIRLMDEYDRVVDYVEY